MSYTCSYWWPIPGPAGPQGFQGPRGPQGAEGPLGPSPTGPAGPAGPAGQSSQQPGPDGPQGPQGPTGLTGPDGPQGPQGFPSQEPGPDGPQGPSGIQGPLGVTGSQGPLGPEGETGEAGATGATGPTGLPSVPTIYALGLPTGQDFPTGAGDVNLIWEQYDPYPPYLFSINTSASPTNSRLTYLGTTGVIEVAVQINFVNVTGDSADDYALLRIYRNDVLLQAETVLSQDIATVVSLCSCFDVVLNDTIVVQVHRTDIPVADQGNVFLDGASVLVRQVLQPTPQQ